LINKIPSILVHIFTSLGVVFGFLALVATLNHDIKTTFFWLGVALIVDGVDGSLARKYDVKTNTPYIDGSVLDNIIDYFTYVIIPALMVIEFKMVSEELTFFVAITILLTSCFTFSNVKLKTDDFYFLGFPAAWNLVVLYIYILELSKITSLLLIIFCAIFTFIPIKTLHPFRVEKFRLINLFITFLWIVSIGVLLFGNSFQEPFYLIFIVTTIWFTLITVIRTLKGE
tara:strand:+ start:462 stop:1145 length:684 start_codon:yes stop_codon:yes gene_type:complete